MWPRFGKVNGSKRATEVHRHRLIHPTYTQYQQKYCFDGVKPKNNTTVAELERVIRPRLQTKGRRPAQKYTSAAAQAAKGYMEQARLWTNIFKCAQRAASYSTIIVSGMIAPFTHYEPDRFNVPAGSKTSHYLRISPSTATRTTMHTQNRYLHR